MPLQLNLEKRDWLSLSGKFSFLEKPSCNILLMVLQSNLAALLNVMLVKMYCHASDSLGLWKGIVSSQAQSFVSLRNK